VKIVLVTIQTPFIHGGAEYLIGGLQQALLSAGHTVEQVSMPFRFHPLEQVRRSMETWASEDFTLLNGHAPELAICFQFPAYYVQHPNKTLWLMHQFRTVYDLWETPFASEFKEDAGATTLRDRIRACDRQHLAQIPNRFAISQNTSSRLKQYNDVSSAVLYHPPPSSSRYFCAPAESYIFAPGRLEELKRHDLLIRAMARVKTPIIAVIAGEGGQSQRLRKLVAELDLSSRVQFVGQITEEEKIGLYAHAVGVFFGPFDEDLGYVTLEGMLAAKPVITCSDSGGPLEFIRSQETGIVVAPDPQEIANAVDFLNSERKTARTMGENAQQQYHDLGISWDSVVQTLAIGPNRC
jgi:glycosyltransferase involved in cell wall biosynthesis